MDMTTITTTTIDRSNVLADLAARVDTKCHGAERIGNDATPSADPAVTLPKATHCSPFGNDGLGFIRVRKRTLKGGDASWRAYRERAGTLVTASMSFDLVRAVRVDGKPRHKFVLGLGSLKDNRGCSVLAGFWIQAIRKMRRHGLDVQQRHCLANQMARKGAPWPTAEQCDGYVESWNKHFEEHMDELKTWIAR